MTKYGKALILLSTLLALAAAGAGAAAWWMYGKVRDFEREHGGDVFALKSRAQLDEEVKKAIAEQTKQPVQTNAVATAATFTVESVDYNGDDTLTLALTAQPDMEVVRQYITVEPMNEGVISFRSSYNGYSKKYTLAITGDFAFGSEVTLAIRKGFCGLEDDFRYVFTRNDRKPNLAFADSGRYLPPSGARAVALKSVNVAKVKAKVRVVPPANIVQMLAIEEQAYDYIQKNWWRGDEEEFVGDLSGEPEKFELFPANGKNVEARTALSLGNRNGIYFVEIGGDSVKGLRRGRRRGDEDVPDRCRVVCVTDLGLSVRQTGDGLLVWVNSLTTGCPVSNARIMVYSSANVLVAKGITDEMGLCRTERVAPGTPFAVAAITFNGCDGSFIALRDSMEVDENYPGGSRDEYLKGKECSAFVWTERGIYRHDEPVFLHAILRGADGFAPEPFPVEVCLYTPSDDLFAKKTLVPDENGAICDATFAVPTDAPSGTWEFRVVTPGKDGALLGSRSVKIEEFAPPQIRVGVKVGGTQSQPSQEAEANTLQPASFAFTVSAEHLYGGAAKGLKCEGAVLFEDLAFAPANWNGYHFGNDDLGLKPSFRRLGKGRLDDRGQNVFQAPLWKDAGKPKAALRATAQGTVFEDGGRPATARVTSDLHYYPYYIGATLPNWLRRPEIGFPQVEVACVRPNAERVEESKRLVAKIERIDSVYAYRRNAQGWATWDCERVRTVVAEQIALETLPDRDIVLQLPLRECGDYVLTIIDPDTEVSFAREFYLSDWGDEAVRAPLSRPTAVTVAPDKPFYRVGESPRLVIKAPFTGNALIAVLRDDLECVEVVALTNATSEIVLPPVPVSWWPSVDVSVSVVQGVQQGVSAFAARAHGEATISVRPVEHEIPVSLDATVNLTPDDGSVVAVSVFANTPHPATKAVVTVVDEGINLLTDEPLPNPILFFAQPRASDHPLFDLYHRLLPVLGDDILKASGIKTGGGFGAEMLSRVSPVPTRRFKPLALWQTEIPIVGGSGVATFRLPEFVGEIRITAVVYTDSATGSAAVTRKVAPNVVMQPDAPRFVAPGDEFDITLPISNRSGEAADVAYEVASSELEFLPGARPTSGSIRLAKDESTILVFRAKATGVGEARIVFSASGAGERHEKAILLPVRPAVAWRETAGVDILKPGESKVYPAIPANYRRDFSVSASPVAELKAALDWLADYPHGCLEQTCSRMFPLLSLGGRDAANRDILAAGIRRVESMIRSADFVMWPDCDYAPWDREVSLYAVHFLVEAGKVGGLTVHPSNYERVLNFAKKWAMLPDDSVSAYACLTLALAGKPEKDRMLRLYDNRGGLDALARARLARAFTAVADRRRAAELLATAGSPASLKEAAFSLLALLELDPQDGRIPALVAYLFTKRDKTRCSWGTTEDNAHALIALGAYYANAIANAQQDGAGAPLAVSRLDNADGSVRFTNPGPREAFVSWKQLSLPPVESVKPESNIIGISRTFLTPEGQPVDLATLTRGEPLVVELRLSSSEERDYSDIVIEDLFAGAIEPVHSSLEAGAADHSWVMRYDARDDRMLVFSKKFHLGKGGEVAFRYPARVVTAGDFVLPGTSVEAMYAPEIHANSAPARLKVVGG